MKLHQIALYEEDDLRQELESMVLQAHSAKQVADEMGISPSYLSDILAARRGISDMVAQRLGYKAERIYVKE